MLRCTETINSTLHLVGTHNYSFLNKGIDWGPFYNFGCRGWCSFEEKSESQQENDFSISSTFQSLNLLEDVARQLLSLVHLLQDQTLLHLDLMGVEES